MFGRLLILWLLAMTLPIAAQAQTPERQFLGWGRLFNNDFLGDGQDRWRTGSYTISVLKGPTVGIPECRQGVAAGCPTIPALAER